MAKKSHITMIKESIYVDDGDDDEQAMDNDDYIKMSHMMRYERNHR